MDYENNHFYQENDYTNLQKSHDSHDPQEYKVYEAKISQENFENLNEAKTKNFESCFLINIKF